MNIGEEGESRENRRQTLYFMFLNNPPTIMREYESYFTIKRDEHETYRVQQGE